VRGGKPYAAYSLARNGGAPTRPQWHLVGAGIAALAFGFTLGLAAMPVRFSVSETSQPKNPAKNPDIRVSVESAVPDQRPWRLASLDSTVVFAPAAADRQAEPAAEDTALGSDGRSFAERYASYAAIDSDGRSFDERYATLFGLPVAPPAAETPAQASSIPLPQRNPGGHAAPRHPTQSGFILASLPPAAAAKQPPPAAAAVEEPISPEADGHTAIYDISAHTVYLPDGRRLEAHSGMGSRLDDPRYVSERDRGPTPPNVYDLSLREESFHGVRALRLNPVGNGNMYGRAGMLAHSYMLGPNGQSNGCVSFNDYQAFLKAYLSGEVTRLVVVERLGAPPASRTALDWIPEKIRALFGRS
jgi:hypothetical protein